MKKLLASDMDGTLIPIDHAPEHRQSIRDFADAVENEHDLTLAYVTGRHLELVLQAVEEYSLPVPSFISGDVGTTIYERVDEHWEQNRAYQMLMQTRLGGGRGEDIDSLLEPFDSLTPQEKEKQSDFKRSFYTPSDFSETEVQSIRDVLNAEGFQVSLITSEDAFAERGLLDVLPEGVAKDTAVNFLQQVCQADTEHTVFSGDSGNDIKVFQKGVQSTLVGNASAKVQASVDQLIHENPGLENTVYRAKGYYAAGVIEGARHFGIL